jgi:hypothetical protein
LPLILQRLWFKTNLKLCKIFFDIGEYGRMSKVTFFFGCNDIYLASELKLMTLSIGAFVVFCQILKELHKSCQREDGTDDHKKGTQLLEVYAIEIQMYTETKNNKKLKVGIFYRIFFFLVTCMSKIVMTSISSLLVFSTIQLLTINTVFHICEISTNFSVHLVAFFKNCVFLEWKIELS